MKEALLAGVLAGLVSLGVACGGTAENSGKKSGEPTPVTRVPPQDEDEVDSKGKSWKGWRYTGSRDDCYFLYKGRCYTSEKKACKAAGCDVDDCDLEGAGPATVSCPKR